MDDIKTIEGSETITVNDKIQGSHSITLNDLKDFIKEDDASTNEELLTAYLIAKQ